MISEKSAFLLILALLMLAGLAGAILNIIKGTGNIPFSAPVQNFEECLVAGYPIMESYPRQCRVPNGRVFVENVKVNEGECIRAGCSGELCVEEGTAEGLVTTCEYRPQYACYKDATCARQNNGACGWMPTKELLQCLSEAQE